MHCAHPEDTRGHQGSGMEGPLRLITNGPPPELKEKQKGKKNIYTSSYRQELQDGPTFHNAESHPDCFLVVLSSVYDYLVVR